MQIEREDQVEPGGALARSQRGIYLFQLARLRRFFLNGRLSGTRRPGSPTMMHLVAFTTKEDATTRGRQEIESEATNKRHNIHTSGTVMPAGCCHNGHGQGLKKNPLFRLPQPADASTPKQIRVQLGYIDLPQSNRGIPSPLPEGVHQMRAPTAHTFFCSMYPSPSLQLGGLNGAIQAVSAGSLHCGSWPWLEDVNIRPV